MLSLKSPPFGRGDFWAQVALRRQLAVLLAKNAGGENSWLHGAHVGYDPDRPDPGLGVVRVELVAQLINERCSTREVPCRTRSSHVSPMDRW